MFIEMIMLITIGLFSLIIFLVFRNKNKKHLKIKVKENSNVKNKSRKSFDIKPR